jgi:hypothetical protein
LLNSFIFRIFVKIFKMKKEDIEKTLSYCLYVCHSDDLKNSLELDFLHKKIITETHTEKDIKDLFLLKERLMKQFRD